MKLILRARMIVLACGLSLSAFTADAGPDQVMGGGLRHLVHAWETADPRLPSHLNLHLKSASGDPLVHVKLEDGTTLADALPRLQAAGFRLTAASQLDASRLEGYVPLSQARAAAALPGVRAISAVQRPHANAGSVQSQAVALHKADLVQARGVDGTGIRVGVVSTSYDTCATCSTHAADDIASGDLPAAGVTVLEDLPPGPDSTDEGRAMLQLVHDIAPGARLGFAQGVTGPIAFSNNILRLRQVFGADVIVDDLVYFEPIYSDGIIAQAIDAVSRDGAAYFSIAGNNGVEAFEADYQPIPFDAAQRLVARTGANIKLDQIPAGIRPKSLHLFSGRADDDFRGRPDDDAPSITQRFTTFPIIPGNFITFQWDEPFFLGKVKTDFNIYVFDANGNWMDPDSPDFPGFYTTDDNTQSDTPDETLFLPTFAGEIHGGLNASDYQLVIGKVNDGPARHFTYVNLNGLGTSQRQGAPSVVGHSAARGSQTVAATHYALPSFPEDFSSGGPVRIFFDAQGNRLAEPEIRLVPQITAVDGVDTTFFGFVDSDGNGLPNFFGTSAAAPNAAAVAALVLQAAGGPGSLAPHDLYRLLQATASPIPTPNDRTTTFAELGPIKFSTQGDFPRWENYFGLALDGHGYAVKSVAFDLADTGLIWNTNPNRFHIGDSNGVTLAAITRTVSADTKIFMLTFAPGSFRAGQSFRFGMSAFSPIQGFPLIDPDRLRGTRIAATLENGAVVSGQVVAAPKLPFNRFTGAGLLNADAAVRAARAVRGGRSAAAGPK